MRNRQFFIAIGAIVIFVLSFDAQVIARDAENSLAQPWVKVLYPANVTKCRYQQAQSFLTRGTYNNRGGLSKKQYLKRSAIFEKSVRYRTETYGYVKGFGKHKWNKAVPAQNSETTTFFGRRVRLHKKIIPVLQCVENQILHECKAYPYKPQHLSGLRTINTYHNGDVSNHMFGIAIDIDPLLNPCCGCIPPWNKSPLCRKKVKSVFERMKMPKCWVNVFERFGFYWLGHDRLKDTMHFEFLGKPDQIIRKDKK